MRSALPSDDSLAEMRLGEQGSCESDVTNFGQEFLCQKDVGALHSQWLLAGVSAV